MQHTILGIHYTLICSRDMPRCFSESMISHLKSLNPLAGNNGRLGTTQLTSVSGLGYQGFLHVYHRAHSAYPRSNSSGGDLNIIHLPRVRDKPW